MKTEQLEIGFGSANQHRRVMPAQRRRQRAKWWFHQMRLAVEAVTGGRPAGTPPPEQTYLTLTS